MADLADDPPAPLLGVVHPVLGRQEAGVDPAVEQQRLAGAGEVIPDRQHHRREAPVVADLDERLAAGRLPPRGQLGLDLDSSSPVRQSGFSTKTALPARRAASTWRAWRWWRVAITTAVTAGSASTSASSVVAERKPKRLAAWRACTPPAVQTVRRSTPGSRERMGRSTPVANWPAPSTPRTTGAAATWRWPAAGAATGGLATDAVDARATEAGDAAAVASAVAVVTALLRIGDQHRQRRLGRPGGDQRVGAGSVGDREAVGDQRRHVHLALGEQSDERLHVAVLGPADVAERVVVPLFLVGGVVAARAVGARHPEAQLLVVVGLARQLQAHRSHRHHRAAIAGRLAGQRHRLGRRSGGGDQHPVGAAAAGERAAGGEEVGGVAGGGGGAQGLGPPAAPGVGIHSHHLAAGGAGEGDGEQSHQPEADHRHRLPQLGAREPQALEGDRADGGEGAGLEADAGREHRRQPPGHEDHLGVAGVAGAGAGDPVAGAEAVDSGADGDHRSRRGVAEGDRHVEPAAHRLDGGGQAVAPGLGDHLAHQVGPLARLAEQALAGQLDHRPLGARADQRGGRPHQHAAGPEGGRRHLGHLGRAAAVALDDGFHLGDRLTSRARRRALAPDTR